MMLSRSSTRTLRRGAGSSGRPKAAVDCCSARGIASRGSRQHGSGRASSLRAKAGGGGGAAGAGGEEEDLMQFPDRLRWYEAKFAADDMPDWNGATLLRREEAAPGIAVVTLGVEASRERVPLRNAYVAAGQLARVRVGGGEERLLPVASPPPGVAANSKALFMTRGDIFAGETKTAREPVSTEATVDLVVERSAAPELFNVQLDDSIELGPFEGTGVDLRSSGILAAFRFPTVVVFASGPAGAAAARALVESPPDVAGLSPQLRRDVVVYYSVPNEASALFRDRFEAWGDLGPVRAVVTTRGFADAFDGDDKLFYDPDETAAVILTGGDAEAEAAAREVCAEAEIATVVSDGAHAAPPVFLDATPQSFQKWAKKHPGRAAAAPAEAAGDAEGRQAGDGDESDEEEVEEEERGAISVR